MTDGLRLTCCASLAALFLTVLGCAPATSKRPDLNTSSSPDASGGRGSRPGEGQQSGPRESDTDRSSLKQMQEGNAPVTPASSPLQDIFFEFDRADLRGEARDTLRANADWLKAHPADRVEIEGHCDERGTNEYNLALGAKRAQTAKDYLVSLGIAADRLSTISYGEEIPVCTQHEEACWQRNRRARFVIVSRRPAS